jgi:5-methyltetrahydrofolate--homocysteine methyltransferase
VHDIGKNIVGVVLGCNGYDVVDLGVMVSCDKILHAAKEHGAQAIGLSGLITPSLEEMSHVAAEMQRQGFADGADGGVPLLIGGATTSRAHTAIKIAPNYSGPVVYVPDASRAVGVVTKLLSIDHARRLQGRGRRRLREGARAQHANKKGVQLVTLEARAPTASAWNADAGYRPCAEKPGLHVLRDIDLATLAEYIDWGPFFQTWDLAGSYPEDPRRRGRRRSGARTSSPTAQAMLEQIIAEKWLTANAVFGLFPANASVTTSRSIPDETRTRSADDLAQPAPAARAPGGKPHHCLSRLRRAERARRLDRRLCRHRRPRHREASSPSSKPLTTTTARSCSSRSPTASPKPAPSGCTREVRKDYWGYAADETLDNEALIREEYRGIRPAPGYPACPDHTAKGALFALLDAPANIGMGSPSPSP